jgi:hypothetical protein
VAANRMGCPLDDRPATRLAVLRLGAFGVMTSKGVAAEHVEESLPGLARAMAIGRCDPGRTLSFVVAGSADG